MSVSPQDATDSTADFLLEGEEPGLPLIISFGFYAVGDNPQFDFYGRLKKVALVSGRAANHLYLRDIDQLWYLRGIRSLGSDVDSTVAALRRTIEKLRPSSITTIGQSMGAYAAILYGILLAADKAIAFGPLSCFDLPRWELLGERRWELIRQRLVASGSDVAPYDDLPGLLRTAGGNRPMIDLFYGMSPDDNGSNLNIGHDVAHAARFEGIDHVTLLPVPASGHAVVEYFRRNAIITDVIMYCLYGTPLELRIAELDASSAWATWFKQNIAAGCSEAQLIDTMRQQPMAETAIRTIVDCTHSISVLRMIAARSAPAPLLMKAPYDPEEESHACCSDPRHQHR